MRHISYFDRIPYSFVCPSPNCGQQFELILRSLIQADEVTCPGCGAVIDIRESKRAGDLGLTFNDAGELDKQATQEPNSVAP
jgi:DNA-directed RNA polymerase subunit RPC12/RpoP